MPDNLALRMRPKTIDQVIGQEHLVGPGKINKYLNETGKEFKELTVLELKQFERVK